MKRHSHEPETREGDCIHCGRNGSFKVGQCEVRMQRHDSFVAAAIAPAVAKVSAGTIGERIATGRPLTWAIEDAAALAVAIADAVMAELAKDSA
jgi:hypothetical protein